MFYKLAVILFITIQLLIYLPLKFLINAIIMSLRDDEQCSDDEVFYGKLSLGELKHMFISHQNNRQTIAANEHLEDDNHDTSLKLISTHSEPDITSNRNHELSPENIPKSMSNTTLSPDEPNLFQNWDVTNSFLNLEKMVEKSCDTSSKEFDNTLEEIEYILKNTPKSKKKTANTDCKEAKSKETEIERNQVTNQVNKAKVANNAKLSAVITPMKQVQKEKEVFATPSSVLHTKPTLCKTPANPSLFKKPSTSSVKKTPSKNNAFQHVASPVAYYINNSPQIPLIQNVHPKKTLSSIPKLVKSSTLKSSNKENVNLPSVAYKSAKKTTVIDVSNAPKMPESQWAKKLTKSLPRPAVIKHTHREKDFFNKQLLKKPEDSFGDLSLHQADISVCTKKAAF
ncbi:uncharacterized protein LOC125225601 [Leguminivora glycinivorella]|uniref:uncharacterized protein LOC125225601 n=1 Tax=Leguminivora glycinivorella TaxID=1035111 RepID=UPI00200D68C8|nr:uncharacterized protein LOC125225601 [Leguminivora glycinivorella]